MSVKSFHFGLSCRKQAYNAIRWNQFVQTLTKPGNISWKCDKFPDLHTFPIISHPTQNLCKLCVNSTQCRDIAMKILVRLTRKEAIGCLFVVCEVRCSVGRICFFLNSAVSTWGVTCRTAWAVSQAWDSISGKINQLVYVVVHNGKENCN